MTLIERLRTVQGDNEDARKAAEEIERLRAALLEIDRLAARHPRGAAIRAAQKRAREALGFK
jgi:hypothetical protein